MRDLARTILDLMGDPITPSSEPWPNSPTEIWSMRSDVTKAPTSSGSSRPSVAEGLEHTIAWYRESSKNPAHSFPPESTPCFDAWPTC